MIQNESPLEVWLRLFRTRLMVHILRQGKTYKDLASRMSIEEDALDRALTTDSVEVAEPVLLVTAGMIGVDVADLLEFRDDIRKLEKLNIRKLEAHPGDKEP